MSSSDSILIDCGTCSLSDTPACDDCVVAYILSISSSHDGPANEPVDEGGVVVDAAEFFAVRRLQAAGLVPELRHDAMETETG